MTIRRTLLATLTAAALIAPAAQARPADVHAPLARAAEKAQIQAQPQQDLRSPDARDAGQNLRRTGQLPPAGQPTWPADPAPLEAPAQQQPATDDGGSPVPVLPIAAGVLLVLAAAVTARYGTRRMHRRARIAA